LTFGMNDSASMSVLVQGNDIHGNNIGVHIIGDGRAQPIAHVDLGGGTLGSLGGNNFRGFTATGQLFAGAIVLDNTNASTTIPAQKNIFQTGVDPSTVIDDGTHGGHTGSGTLDVSQPLSSGRSFVQTLFNDLLGRSGAVSELDPWVQLLNSRGQAAVVNGIVRSSEALGRIVDSLYLRFLGRQADAAGRSGWIGFLQQGGTLEALETAFLTAPEYINHINTDYVQSLYLNILGRTGSAAELATWNNNIQSLGLTGIANGFTHSTENRLNTLRSFFQMFLHRTPSNSELMPFVNSSSDLLSLAVVVLSSTEYFNNG